MPQLVAAFNGVGGGAAALVALIELSDADSRSTLIAALFTVVVGSVSFSGSAVTFLKLQELITGRPITFPGGHYLFGALVAASGGAGGVAHGPSGALGSLAGGAGGIGTSGQICADMAISPCPARIASSPKYAFSPSRRATTASRPAARISA